jgi:dynactin complex subunit
MTEEQENTLIEEIAESIINDTGEFALIRLTELKRLQKLDENIKKEIDILKLKLEEANQLARMRYFKPVDILENIDSKVFELEDEIRRLESLYR